MTRVERDEAILVVGADSTIGGGLIANPRRWGGWVMGTTRRSERVDNTHPYPDLACGLSTWECPAEAGIAVVCAGVTRFIDCRNNAEASYQVNVRGICSLVEKLVGQGLPVIYLSSNHVFDGAKPRRLPEDPTAPITEYGRQKAEAERSVRQWGDRVMIVRFAKVLGPRVPIFSDWTRSLLAGKTIHPYLDVFMAPIPLFFAVDVLERLCDEWPGGILHVSGERDVSFAEAARLGAEVLGVDPALVRPVSGRSSGRQDEPLADYTSLNVDRLKAELGMEPPFVDLTIASVFAEPSWCETGVSICERKPQELRS